MKKNKIILFVLALVLLSGIIMVCLKGFKVSLDLRAHDTLKFVFDKKYDENDVTKICNEVFKNKEYELKTVEVFSDAIYIISPSISEVEEKALLEKLDNLYKDENDSKIDEEKVENIEESESVGLESILDKLEEGSKYKLYKDSNVRIRDVVRPYAIPSAFSLLIVSIYIAIRYRKLNNGKILVTVCKTLGELLIIVLEMLSVIVITRIPFTRALIPILMFIIVIVLCIRLCMFEKKLKEIE